MLLVCCPIFFYSSFVEFNLDFCRVLICLLMGNLFCLFFKVFLWFVGFFKGARRKRKVVVICFSVFFCDGFSFFYYSNLLVFVQSVER